MSRYIIHIAICDFFSESYRDTNVNGNRRIDGYDEQFTVGMIGVHSVHMHSGVQPSESMRFTSMSVSEQMWWTTSKLPLAQPKCRADLWGDVKREIEGKRRETRKWSESKKGRCRTWCN